MSSMNITPIAAAERIVALLVNGDYAAIDGITGGRNVTSIEIEQAVREYGRTLISPPDGVTSYNQVQVRGRAPASWSVRCDLWTIEEGRSDLTLELTVTDSPNGVQIEVDGLHVL